MHALICSLHLFAGTSKDWSGYACPEGPLRRLEKKGPQKSWSPVRPVRSACATCLIIQAHAASAPAWVKLQLWDPGIQGFRHSGIQCSGAWLRRPSPKAGTAARFQFPPSFTQGCHSVTNQEASGGRT